MRSRSEKYQVIFLKKKELKLMLKYYFSFKISSKTVLYLTVFLIFSSYLLFLYKTGIRLIVSSFSLSLSLSHLLVMSSNRQYIYSYYVFGDQLDFILNIVCLSFSILKKWNLFFAFLEFWNWLVDFCLRIMYYSVSFYVFIFAVI